MTKHKGGSGFDRDYFSASYPEARNKFLERARRAGLPVSTYVNPLSGPAGEELATDVVRLGPKAADRVMVLQTGLHGPEGHAGSALLLAALDDVELADDGDLALLLVHAINPWGYAWSCRSNEDNIDLNRHFLDWSETSLPDNPGYAVLADAILPDGPDEEALAAGHVELEAYRAAHGAKAFHNAVKGGQYAFPQGLFYGGRSPSWSARTVERIADDHLRGAGHLGLIDIHTGLGPFAFGECLSGSAPDSPEGLRASAWYGAVAHTKNPKTDYGATSASSLDGYKRAAPGPVWTPIGLEFGTRDERTVLDVMRLDLWLRLNGGAENPHAEEIRQRILDAFYPDEPEWRRVLLDRGLEVLRLGLAGIAAQRA